MDGLWQEYIFVCNLTGCEELLSLDILVMKVEVITSYIYFNFKILLSPSPFSFISVFILFDFSCTCFYNYFLIKIFKKNIKTCLFKIFFSLYLIDGIIPISTILSVE